MFGCPSLPKEETNKKFSLYIVFCLAELYEAPSMRSSVDRHARPITIAILSAYVVLIAGSQLLGLHPAGLLNGHSPTQSAGPMFDNIVACSYFVFAASLVLLISRSRKNFFLNWVVGSLGVFLLAEALSH